jgi:uncharacterized cupredoxin-like copper-binding protein
VQHRAIALGGLLLVAIIVISACSSGQVTSGTASGGVPATSAPNGVQEMTVTVGNSMDFDPSFITVQADQPVRLTLRNNGLMPHDLTLTDGVAQPVKVTATGGQSASIIFTIEKPGTYSFECSMPGHAAAGMRGTITAQ